MRLDQDHAARSGYRGLLVSRAALGEALQPVPSELPVNRAVHRAAHFTPSEALRPQKRGHAEALRDTEDGVGFVQAEDPLTGDHSTILRMRGTAVESQNDTQAMARKAVITDLVEETGARASSVDVMAGAQAAVATIENAINLVSSMHRAVLAGVQARLDHVIAYLAVAATNLVASECRGQGDDGAAVVNLSRRDVITRQGIAVLARADQVPLTAMNDPT